VVVDEGVLEVARVVEGLSLHVDGLDEVLVDVEDLGSMA
jgi:hypothetical protein